MMNKQEIIERLNSIFRDVFDDENISVNENTTAKDVNGWDSLMYITLIATIEDDFKIKFDMKEIISMNNVGKMISLIEEKLKA